MKRDNVVSICCGTCNNYELNHQCSVGETCPQGYTCASRRPHHLVKLTLVEVSATIKRVIERRRKVFKADLAKAEETFDHPEMTFINGEIACANDIENALLNALKQHEESEDK